MNASGMSLKGKKLIKISYFTFLGTITSVPIIMKSCLERISENSRFKYRIKKRFWRLNVSTVFKLIYYVISEDMKGSAIKGLLTIIEVQLILPFLGTKKTPKTIICKISCLGSQLNWICIIIIIFLKDSSILHLNFKI